jgi:hypothetical protein
MNKSRTTDVFDEINALHEHAQQMAREYEASISSGDFSLDCPYQEIIEIYDEIMKMIVAYDGWGFDSDNNYQVYEASYFNIQQEFERKLEEDTNLRKSRHK